MNFEPHAVSVLVFEYCPSLYALRRHRWRHTVYIKASTSITLTLLAFHCNLYIIDDVDLFVKSSVPKNLSIAVNFTVTSVGVRQLCLRRIGVRSQKSLKTAALNCHWARSHGKQWLISRHLYKLNVICTKWLRFQDNSKFQGNFRTTLQFQEFQDCCDPRCRKLRSQPTNNERNISSAKERRGFTAAYVPARCLKNLPTYSDDIFLEMWPLWGMTCNDMPCYDALEIVRIIIITIISLQHNLVGFIGFWVPGVKPSFFKGPTRWASNLLEWALLDTIRIKN